jgi:predicted DNA-binding transcriptional regulator YafY
MDSKRTEKKSFRLIAMIRLLETGAPYTIEGLSELFGVSPRSVYRDLNDLRAFNVPIYLDNQGYRLNSAVWSKWVKKTLKMSPNRNPVVQESAIRQMISDN